MAELFHDLIEGESEFAVEVKRRVERYMNKKVFDGPQLNFKKAEKGFENEIKRKRTEKRRKREKARKLKKIKNIKSGKRSEQSPSPIQSDSSSSEEDISEIQKLDDQEFLTKYFDSWMMEYDNQRPDPSDSTPENSQEANY